jgi:Sec-independent protein translocase protein TatA
MDILGIGPLELVFILIIALIVLGPKDMVKAGRTIGKFLRQIITSPTWHAVTRTSQELRNLPNKLIRDAGLEDDLKEIQDATKSAIPPSINQDLTQWQKDINSWTTPPSIGDPKTDPTLAQDSATDINGKPEIDRSNQSAANTDSHDEDQAEQAGTTDTEHNDPQGQAD